MESKRILAMQCGSMMDELITAIMKNIDSTFYIKNWSTNVANAFELRDFATAIGINVCSIKHSGLPVLLEEYCSMSDVDDAAMVTAYSSGDFAESMARTFLLYHFECYGDYVCNDFNKAVSNAKRRNAQVIEIISRKPN